MPLVEATLVEGRTPEQIRALIEALTVAVETSLDAPRSAIRVIIREVPPTHWAAGGVTIAEQRSNKKTGPDT